MKKETSQHLRIYKALSGITILLGVLLLTFMITVESEPGALPLFLLLFGSIWYLIIQYKIKKQ